MARTWPTVKLGDVAEEITVGHVGSMASEYVQSGIPFLRSLNIEPYRVSMDDIRYIDDDFHSRLKKSALRPGDVVVVRTGKPGTATVIPEWLADANCSDLVIIRPGRNLDPRYLAYYINTAAASHVAAHLVGAVQQHFNVASARDISLELPPLPEQLAIAHVLGTLDDKIELNRQMNQTLEQIAAALFRSWFIDFDPVRAKMAGREPEGMDASTAALFPERLVASDVGEIPEGWRIEQVGDVVSVVGGSTPSTTEPSFWSGDIPFATPKDLSKLNAPILLETERGITDAGLARISSGLIPRHSVLLSSRAPIGYLAVNEVPVTVNQGMIVMICDQGLSPWYMLNWAKANADEFVNRANGTTFLEISKRNFRPIPVTRPKSAVLNAFDALVEPLFSKLTANLREINTLSELRDTLLPRLLSGELRVSALNSGKEVV